MKWTVPPPQSLCVTLSNVSATAKLKRPDGSTGIGTGPSGTEAPATFCRSICSLMPGRPAFLRSRLPKKAVGDMSCACGATMNIVTGGPCDQANQRSSQRNTTVAFSEFRRCHGPGP
ncbi:MAG TPA: hypothetical protein VFF31_12625, partial [Blastocatellia bacterium]|nr:hypothetical protein [Blastocatellia bacterium]